jgi:hypothetical protein
LKRGSLPGRQAVADPFAKFDNEEKADNEYKPFADVKKPESIPSQVNEPQGSSLINRNSVSSNQFSAQNDQ